MTPEEERAEIRRLDAETRRLRAEGDAKFRAGFREGAEIAKRRVKMIYAAFALGLFAALVLFACGRPRAGLVTLALVVGTPLCYVLRVLYLFWKYPQARQLAREEYERFSVREEVARQQELRQRERGQD